MFYRFECHSGDDNFQTIGDVVVDAASLEDALEVLLKEVQHLPDVIIDGDGERLYALWYEDEEGDIPLHHDFYFQEVYDTYDAALRDFSIWHWNYDPVCLDASTREEVQECE